METSTDQQLATRTEPRQEKAPVISGARGLKLQSLDDMWRFALCAVNSGIYKDISSPEVAVIKIQAGLELGLTPVWALTNIFVVNGKPTVYGDAFLGIVLAHRECEDVVETMEGEGDKLTAVCEARRRGRVPVVRRFSVSDAKKASLWGKAGPWTQYPSRMLQMRARAFACRDAFADALRGLGVREELEGITEPKPTSGRVVSREMVLDAPTHVEVEQRVSDEAATEHLEHVADESTITQDSPDLF